MNREDSQMPDNDIAQLLSIAGKRDEPPAQVQARVRAAVMASFEELPHPETRRLRRFIPITAAAAALALAIVLLERPAQQIPSAGEILFSSGETQVQNTAGTATRVRHLTAGSSLHTGQDGRLLVALGSQTQLRADAQTSVTVESATEIRLHQGRIYIDSAAGEKLSVRTRYGTVEDIGTQFEVIARDDTLAVAVREGSVNVSVGDRQLSSRAASGHGERLRFEQTRLTERSVLSTTDSHWQWIHRASPGFKLQNHSVAEFLDWAARESGRTLDFESALVRQQAEMPAALQGNAAVGADLETINQVLRTTRFEQLPAEEHQLLIGFRSM